MKPLVVLCDMDGIVANLDSKWYPDICRIYGDNFTAEDVKHWDLEKTAVKAGMRIYDILREPGYYRDLPVLPGAREAVHELVHTKVNGEKAFDVYFVTSAIVSPHAPHDKMEWVNEHFPFLGEGRSGAARKVITAYHKELIKGDVLIDDGPHNIKRTQEAWPDTKTVVIDYPYNREVAPNFRAYDYKDTYEAWQQILMYLLRLTKLRYEAAGEPVDDHLLHRYDNLIRYNYARTLDAH